MKRHCVARTCPKIDFNNVRRKVGECEKVLFSFKANKLSICPTCIHNVNINWILSGGHRADCLSIIRRNGKNDTSLIQLFRLKCENSQRTEIALTIADYVLIHLYREISHHSINWMKHTFVNVRIVENNMPNIEFRVIMNSWKTQTFRVCLTTMERSE